MSDILKEIGGYPDDASVIMSKRVVNDVIDEIARLRVERDALRADLAYSDKRFSDFVERTSKRTEKADVELAQAHADLAAARELLKEAQFECPWGIQSRIDAYLKGPRHD